MRIVADLHIHSKYSRATSKNMDLDNLSKQAKVKGIHVLGTGDFTHPKWFKELKTKLVQIDDIYIYNDTYFIPSVEISSIYNQDGKLRKIHNVILSPNLEIAEQITDVLKKHGRVDYDGRPIFNIPSYELVEMAMEISKDNFVFPAHIWTPWFSLFGSMSGFDKIEDCYKDQLKHIYALETGLSSDPEMNWRISSLDKFALISNSDSHSPWPNRLGREANVFELEKPSYFQIIDAIKTKDKRRFLFTIEVEPAYGKYHFDGHRECGVVMSPKEAIAKNNICPVCGKPLTLGVLHRVEELADRQPGFVPKNAIPFKKLLPLQEIISLIYSSGIQTQTVLKIYKKLINAFGNELNVLLNASESALKEVVDERLAKAIVLNREEKINVKPGYDGVYGKPQIEEELKIKKQKTLGEF
ncbi:MAG: DNA helicase UvrD [Nanoarchaeota archaeon]|nr:DNA helicase UvrD [Nanoarchaeota archaeon]